MSSYIYVSFFIISTFICIIISTLTSRVLRYVVTLTALVAIIYFWIIYSSINVSFFSIILLILALLQSANLFRAYHRRYGNNTKRRIATTGTALILLSVATVIMASFDTPTIIKDYYFISALLAVCGFIGLVTIKKNIKKILPGLTASDDELPTISVLIPARNEDGQLADCIESVLESDYPKLEILVLDDCSQDKSSEIIKSFAQKGVRFIQGEIPHENWLAKNQAYETLAAAASGDWYLFMGVDVRLRKNSIKTLILGVLQDNKKMAGVLPGINSNSLGQVFTPLRYYWELALPRFIMHHTPVLSSCWIIQDKAYEACGGFRAVSQSVLPERYFADVLDKEDQYIFYKNSSDLSIESNKSYKSHVETSIRLVYPHLSKSFIKVFFMIVLMILTFLAYYELFLALFNGDVFRAVIIIVSLLPSWVTIVSILIYQDAQYKLTRVLVMPYLLVQELVIALISAYKYEFSEVIWKGRNVCYPILKVIPNLPKV